MAEGARGVEVGGRVVVPPPHPCFFPQLCPHLHNSLPPHLHLHIHNSAPSSTPPMTPPHTQPGHRCRRGAEVRRWGPRCPAYCPVCFCLLMPLCGTPVTAPCWCPSALPNSAAWVHSSLSHHLVQGPCATPEVWGWRQRCGGRVWRCRQMTQGPAHEVCADGGFGCRDVAVADLYDLQVRF